ncbi:RidA family protein [Myroides odoratimimus]|uniref:RidA family protein n=1 Tax=Myroides odoratimimus TaxID=76832 RepID=UPI0025760536|nr:Rid family hydrolase [Myroides odoratimimus]MDM1499546.1 RidA family protein [Myroides odoratimimus]
MKNIVYLIGILFSTLTLSAQNGKKSIATPSIASGDHLFISGQIALDPITSHLVNDSFEAEVRQMMSNLKNELDKHHLTYDDLVSATIYLTDINQFEQFNTLYLSYFKDKTPTRTCIAVVALPLKATVEITYPPEQVHVS